MIRVENSRVLFLDEMPIRRLLEFRSEYYPVMLHILNIIYERKIQMVASPITLADLSLRAHEKAQPVLGGHIFPAGGVFRQNRNFHACTSFLIRRG